MVVMFCKFLNFTVYEYSL